MHSLFFLSDDATVVAVRTWHHADRMAEKLLANRVAALEAKLGSKTIEEHFREEAEFIDKLFAYRFEELDTKWGPRFATIERTLGVVQSDARALKTDASSLQTDVNSLKADVSTLKTDVSTLKTDVNTLKDDVRTLKTDVGTLRKDVNTLQKDMTMVRQGVSILLKRLPH
jgi:chromosome segregation ATPase